MNKEITMVVKDKRSFAMGRWVGVTFLGWLLGIILIVIFSAMMDAWGIEHMQFYTGIGMGLGTGFTQWRYLKKVAGIGSAWVWAAVAGMGLPFLVMDILAPGAGRYKLPLCVACGALVAGLLQYAVLKRKMPKAILWSGACFAGWTLGALCVLLMNYTMRLNNTGYSPLLLALFHLLLILAGGLVLGLVTGTALRGLRQRGE